MAANSPQTTQRLAAGVVLGGEEEASVEYEDDVGRWKELYKVCDVTAWEVTSNSAKQPIL